MDVNFVVRVVNNIGEIGGYVRKVENFPFVPTVGMKFKQGTSTWLWETVDGKELNPSIKEIVYNFDEEAIYCLFEIDCFLSSSFWTKIKTEKIDISLELSQFDIH